jgi:hypothetical protein
MKSARKDKYSFPYFKIQQFDKVSLSWKSYKNANFVFEEEAREYLQEDKSGKKLRVMKVDKTASSPLDGK